MRPLDCRKQNLLKALERAKSLPAVIVEGKKDFSAMAHLGFDNLVVLHKEGVSMHSVFDRIKGKECAILTDMDKKGNQYYDLLRKELGREGIKVNNELRRAILANRISHIEGLATFVARILP